MDQRVNGLTPAQEERLAYLIEELAEAQQAACKILRHGFDSFNPTVPEDQQMSNREALARELGDVAVGIAMVGDAGDIDPMTLEHSARKKRRSVHQWMHHQEPFIDPAAPKPAPWPLPIAGRPR